MIADPIATLDGIVLLKPDKTETTVAIRLGRPTLGDHCWECAVEISFLDPGPPIRGETAFQAIHLAMQFVQLRAKYLIDAGATFYFASARDEDPIDADLMRTLLGG